MQEVHPPQHTLSNVITGHRWEDAMNAAIRWRLKGRGAEEKRVPSSRSPRGIRGRMFAPTAKRPEVAQGEQRVGGLGRTGRGLAS